MQEQEYTGADRRRSDREQDLVRAVVVAVRAEVAAQVMPEELHREHHAFINEWIAERTEKRKRMEKIKASVGGWMIISALSGMGTAAYQGFNWVKEHMK